jgi:[acyl-carrier-protein] S-malonyltransferase
MKPRPDHFLNHPHATAFAFRGYNTTNLGRTPELLERPDYGPVVEDALREGSEVCAKAIGRPVDLVSRVRRREETRDLTTYAEDVALVVSVELAQMRLLEQRFGMPMRDAKLAFGYSLGEAAALIAAGMYEMKDLLRVPLALAEDSVALAEDVTMGVLFSRGPAIDMADVKRACVEISQRGDGVIGVSSILSPNAVLLLGQHDTVDRFKLSMAEWLPRAANLRKNPHRWPPLHTPITWQHSIPNRAAVMLQTIPGGLTAPPLPILSSVTGQDSYTAENSRELIHKWVDHPQQLWAQMVEVLEAGVQTIVHVGPEPNLIPATFKRLSEDVRGQLSGHTPGKFGLRLASRMVRRKWLARMLPSAAILLRAPLIQHVNLEDWLLEQKS